MEMAAANEPSFANWMKVTCRYLAGQELFPANPLVTSVQPFDVTHTITGEELHKELLNAGESPEIHLLDQYYAVLPVDYLQDFLEKNSVDSLKWIKDYRDCDNIALYLWAAINIINPSAAFGLAIGITPSGSWHAWNVCRDESGVHFLEPQNDEELDPIEYRAKIFIL